MLEVKPLKYQKITGLSERQLAEHHDVLYAGYVKKYNQIVEQLQEADYAAANATYSQVRELQHEKIFALNAVKLHESYFDNMTDRSTSVGGTIEKLLIKQWGSYEQWANEFAALGLAARGWVVLAYDYTLSRLDNYILDAHNQGNVADSELVLVMDVYEHAYFLDYGTARKDYIAKFMAAIDWEVVNKRVAHQDSNV